MRKLERIVQILFYLLVLVFFFSGVGYNEGFLIPRVVSKILLIVILALIFISLIKYYFFTNK